MPVAKETVITILECGGRGGIHRMWNDVPHYLNYVSLEPDPDECTRLNNLANQNPPLPTQLFKRSLTYLPVAVSGKQESRTLKLYSQRDLSSFYDLNPSASYRYRDASVTLDHTLKVDCETIDSLSASKRFDFLSIDAQGASFEILQGAKSSLLTNILGVRCEAEFINLYSDAALAPQVIDFMVSHGFQLIRLERCGDGTSGVSTDKNIFSINAADALPAWADFIFIRSELLSSKKNNLIPSQTIDVIKGAIFCLYNGAGYLGCELLYQHKEQIAQLFSTNEYLELQIVLQAEFSIYLEIPREPWTTPSSHSLSSHSEDFFQVAKKLLTAVSVKEYLPNETTAMKISDSDLKRLTNHLKSIYLREA